MSDKFTLGAVAQTIIAAPCLVFGALCIAAPDAVVSIAVRDGYETMPIVGAAIAALGAHALAAGLFAAVRRFQPWTFPGFALSFLPIVAADWWLYAKSSAFNAMALAHAAGVVAIMAVCLGVFAHWLRTERSIEDAA
ncbi:MAG: hypothetical protein JNJ73_17440 [Hyphomonadaceae bacterium]|nr:hypothetical protein [Hyphomonadaceae bacterium]